MEAQAPQTSPAPAPASSGGRPWLASRLLQRQVVNASTVELVGRVADVAFDPERCQVTRLIVHPTHSGSELVETVRRAVGADRTSGSVGLDHIIALNGDMVTVDSDLVFSALSSPMGRVARLCSVRDLAIITLHGICLGSLADILLDSRGSVVTGYVVNPTKQAESLLRPFEELEQPSPLHIEKGADTAEASPASEPSAAHLRIIPASPRVRIGKALILLVEEVEPLQQGTVVISHQAGARAARHNGTQSRWTGRNESH
jgi:sporulation protein YlmC with PRC-barrel domain